MPVPTWKPVFPPVNHIILVQYNQTIRYCKRHVLTAPAPPEWEISGSRSQSLLLPTTARRQQQELECWLGWQLSLKLALVHWQNRAQRLQHADAQHRWVFGWMMTLRMIKNMRITTSEQININKRIGNHDVSDGPVSGSYEHVWAMLIETPVCAHKVINTLWRWEYHNCVRRAHGWSGCVNSRWTQLLFEGMKQCCTIIMLELWTNWSIPKT